MKRRITRDLGLFLAICLLLVVASTGVFAIEEGDYTLPDRNDHWMQYVVYDPDPDTFTDNGDGTYDLQLKVRLYFNSYSDPAKVASEHAYLITAVPVVRISPDAETKSRFFSDFVVPKRTEYGSDAEWKAAVKAVIDSVVDNPDLFSLDGNAEKKIKGKDGFYERRTKQLLSGDPRDIYEEALKGELLFLEVFMLGSPSEQTYTADSEHPGIYYYDMIYNVSGLSLAEGEKVTVLFDETYNEAELKDGVRYTQFMNPPKTTPVRILDSEPGFIALKEVAPIEITLDPNKGQLPQGSVTKVTADENGKINVADLPVPIREGYDPIGWFTEAIGGEEVTAETVFTESCAIYAHWQSTDPVTYIVKDDKGNPVELSEDLSSPKRADEVEDKNGKPYVIKEIGPEREDPNDPEKRVADVTVVPVKYDDVKDNQNPPNKVQPKQPLEKPARKDIFEDKNGDPYVVSKVDKPDPDTGSAPVTVVPVDYQVKDDQGKDVKPKDPLKDPKPGMEFTGEDGKTYVVDKVETDKVDPDTGAVPVVAKAKDTPPVPVPVTYKYVDENGKELLPQNPPQTPKAGDKFSVPPRTYAVTTVGAPKDNVSTVTCKRVWNSELNNEDHIAYVQGYPDGTVKPGGNITRAEAATMIFRLLNPERRDAIFKTNNNFSDVKVSSWFNKVVSSMSNGGYIEGYPNGTFGGGRNITRAEFVTIMARILKPNGARKNFPDVKQGSWYYDNVTLAAGAGWIEGYENGTFGPNRNITRAEAMTILNRILERGVNAQSNLGNYKRFSDNVAGKWYYYEVIEASNDHEYTGKRPNENWTKNEVSDYFYDKAKYEDPDK